MFALYFPDGSAFTSHDDRVGRGSMRCVPDTLKEFTVSDAGSTEKVIVSGNKVGRGKNPMQVMAGIEGLDPFRVIYRP